MKRFQVIEETFKIDGNYPQGLNVDELDRKGICFKCKFLKKFKEIKTAQKVFNKVYRPLAKTFLYNDYRNKHKYIKVRCFYIIEMNYKNRHGYDGNIYGYGGNILEYAIEPLKP